MSLSDAQKKSFGYFREMLSEEMSNAGCNDLPNRIFNGWSAEEKMAFVKWAEEEIDDEVTGKSNPLSFGDSILFDYLCHLLGVTK